MADTAADAAEGRKPKRGRKDEGGDDAATGYTQKKPTNPFATADEPPKEKVERVDKSLTFFINAEKALADLHEQRQQQLKAEREGDADAAAAAVVDEADGNDDDDDDAALLLSKANSMFGAGDVDAVAADIVEGFCTEFSKRVKAEPMLVHSKHVARALERAAVAGRPRHVRLFVLTLMGNWKAVLVSPAASYAAETLFAACYRAAAAEAAAATAAKLAAAESGEEFASVTDDSPQLPSLQWLMPATTLTPRALRRVRLTALCAALHALASWTATPPP